MSPVEPVDIGLAKARERFEHLCAEIRCHCTLGSALVFLEAAVFLEYLANAVAGQKAGPNGYKKFVGEWLSKVDARYHDFQYECGKRDLPVQMYHVLRCGIAHNFSLIPQPQARTAGGRDRSIVICHRDTSGGLPHLATYRTGAVPDAALFVAEDFADDLICLVKIVFDEAAQEPELGWKVRKWVDAFPPISGGF